LDGGWLIVAEFFAPAGSRLLPNGRGQLAGRPLAALLQIPGGAACAPPGLPPDRGTPAAAGRLTADRTLAAAAVRPALAADAGAAAAAPSPSSAADTSPSLTGQRPVPGRRIRLLTHIIQTSRREGW
jgi:hypothetical protein